MFGYPTPSLQDPHSIFSASGSGGWANCSGYLEASAGKPDTAGEEAAYGTICHEVTEHALLHGLDRDLLLGQVRKATAGGTEYAFAVDDVMIGYVEDCLDWIADIPPGQTFVETRVDYSDLTPIPHQGGTCDLAVIANTDNTLYIRDWKFGTGVVVYATYPGYDELDPQRFRYLNPQLTLYAYGFFRAYDPWQKFERISIGVAQPRLDHWDIVEIGRDELLAFAAWIKERAFAAWRPNQPRTPSAKACRWCKGQATCDALVALDQRIVDASFEDLTATVQPAEMDKAVAQFREQGIPSNILRAGRMMTADLVALLTYRKLFEERFEAIERELEFRAEQGEDMTPHGLKLVEGRKNKIWNGDFDQTETDLRTFNLPYSVIVRYSLTTPAQAAEAYKAVHGCTKKQAEAAIAKLSSRPVGRPTLAPLNDKRPALVNRIEDTFPDLTTENL